MESFVLLMLPLSVLFVGLVGALMFVDVAYGGSRRLSLAEVRLAQEAMGAARGIGQPALPQPFAVETCRGPRAVPRVTRPEANAIAAELRSQGPAVVERVLGRAHDPKHECPLLTETGLCACSWARPLSCLGKCVAGFDSGAVWTDGLGDALSATLRNHLRARHLDDQTYDLSEALLPLLERPTSPLQKASVPS